MDDSKQTKSYILKKILTPSIPIPNMKTFKFEIFLKRFQCLKKSYEDPFNPFFNPLTHKSLKISQQMIQYF